ncbi:class I SAM-dependent methyltransferase [Pedobacter sp. KBW06]|uniref:class I SAM-dependent methyltransferase n=1 Tax=Pedobacter sp. KBW06 TaxID=2153359 RepID=UPI000F5A59A5|nr:class I SAM-dependent methyltransferase [Pedobacter sp. KBW06]RQO64852.1 class I SAM-dependent methyltransferase [Pedobacter sp. KBW06]
MKKQHIQDTFGNIDIYLFDQLLKSTYDDCHKILDAVCGTGRNLVYLLKSGVNVFGVDQNPEAIAQLRTLASAFPQVDSEENFKVAAVEQLPFENETFDLVISSAVLHFAENLSHFEAMLNSMWDVLKPGGYFFCRLASEIGIESLVSFIGNGRYLLPDGSERFLVNQEMLLRLTKKIGGELHEPIKTANVQNLRSMTTWCVRKAKTASGRARIF